jgi:mobilome CxxCx(11)CxxC protein
MNDLKSKCWNDALNEAGISYVFRSRAKKAKTWLKLTKTLTILSIVIPGAIVLNYNVDSWWVKIIFSLSIVLSVFLTITSIIELVYGKDDALQYFYESASHHANLSKQFELIASDTIISEDNLKERYNQLLGEQKIRDQQDDKYDITPKEERKALRYGLRQYQRECVSCKKTPTSLDSSECDVCGKF